MVETRPDQPEMIQAMVEGLPGNEDTEIAHVGEIRQTEPARLVMLAEDHLLLGTIDRPPGANAPFHGPPDARIKIGVTAPYLLEHRHRPQARCRLE